jgi:peptide/nickel transport system permease protein
VSGTGAILSSRTRRIPLLALMMGVVVTACLVVAVIGPWIAPYPPGQIVSARIFGPVSWRHPLGTDFLGRDMLSRVLIGARYTIGVALPATAGASLTGSILGMLAASRGGAVDAVLSRGMDMLITFPSIIFSMVVVAGFGSSVLVLILTAAIIYAPGCYRIMRAIAVDIEATDFVRVARARGERSAAIMFGEILPNMISPLLTDFGLRFVFIVLLLSSLSFLGLGIQPPLADWGGLVRENIEGLSVGAPAVLAPAVAIAVLTVAVNLLIDNLPNRRARRR